MNRNPLVVDAGVKTGVRVLYEDPKAVGADRIADAAALYSNCMGVQPAWWILGPRLLSMQYLMKAITWECHIPRDWNRCRGTIHSDSKITKGENSQRPPGVIGRNTVHAMQSGLLFGYVALVEGMVAGFRKELGKEMRVIATGGLAEILAAETEIIEVVAPWLTLDGLRIIWGLKSPPPVFEIPLLIWKNSWTETDHRR